MDSSIYHSEILYNCFEQLNLCGFFPQTVMKHVLAILTAVFTYSFHRKTIDFEKYSPCHCTTIAHFLNNDKWDDPKLEDILKASVVEIIYGEALRFPKPCSALRMIPFLPKQSLHHGLCPQSGMRISIPVSPQREAELRAPDCGSRALVQRDCLMPDVASI